MKTALNIFLLIFFIGASPFADANDLKPGAQGPHIQVTLLSEVQALVPGQTITLGVLFEPEQDWHTYWRNPGDSGEAPKIDWQSDTPLQFGEIQWPIPKAIPVAHLVNYGFDGANLLMVDVSVPEGIKTEEIVDIRVDISWLVCKEDCIPGWATLGFSLPVQLETLLSKDAPIFEQARNELPNLSLIKAKHEILDEHIAIEISGLDTSRWTLFPFDSALIQHAGEQQIVWGEEQTARILMAKSAYFSGEATQLQWLLSDGQNARYVDSQLLSATSEVNLSGGANDLSGAELIIYMGMAFIGGLILNLMPCVLPILSIKALALQNNPTNSDHNWSYLLGVLASFNAFAVVILLLQLGGQQVGWGFHMQEPIVVILLAFLFTFIAMTLLDAVPVGNSFAGVGQSLVSGNSSFSHFSTGVLAVIVASPCTAPFMAAALGIALVSEPLITILLFNSLAIGFALPLTLLFMSQKFASMLPKPGLWMVTFKKVLAFPMFLTVAWLCWVFAGQAGVQAQFLLLVALTSFCMFIWLVDKLSGRFMRLAMIISGLLCIGLPVYMYGIQQILVSTASNQPSNAIAFDEFQLTKLKQQGQVVMVNMTADWCITCKVNEQIALTDKEVKSALASSDVTYMVGDWTNKNAEILSYLTQYERAGVPLYVVYAGDKTKQVLPQILTPNIVVNAINQAREER
ncbi:protein-disulfide reductase DsbD [Aliiglaciecola sp. M165]|uniref:protein-disulfide reductase DsbD family protein n=1 Tax=Aliiglaciecola sp. M165 TaxID=2593649 RepID=UPI00163D4CC8|nr:thioredoxin family protein [Aliiglaciecola sp. M165]